MRSPQEHVKSYLSDLQSIFQRMPVEDVARMLTALDRAYAEDRTLFVIGNGGSAATASHMMNDLCKGLQGHKGDATWKRFRVLSLTDNVSLMTAWANDTGYDVVFSEPLKNFAKAGDVLLAISASGNSPNVIKAVEVAKEMKLQIIGFTGFGGGKLAKLSDVAIVVPSNEYGPVEDVHMILDHILITYLYAKRQEEHGAK